MTSTEITLSIDARLQAHEELGNYALRQSVANYFVAQATSSEIVEQTQQRAEKERSNAEFLIKFGELLPDPGRKAGSFMIPIKGLDIEAVHHTVRSLQEHVIWGPFIEAKTYQRLNCGLEAYYIIGRKPIEDEPDYTELLLLSPRVAGAELITTIVSRSDFEARDVETERNRGVDITQEEATRAISHIAPDFFFLDQHTPGSMRLAYRERMPKKRGSTPEELYKYGIRYPNSNYMRRFPRSTPLAGISADQFETFRVDAQLVALAKDFGLEEKLKDMVKVEEADEIEETQETPLTYEQLVDQNERLKNALFRAISFSGLVGRDVVREELERQYPSSNKVVAKEPETEDIS